MSLLVMLAAAAASGLLLDRLQVPGGLIVGSMVGAAAVSLVRGGVAVTVPSPLATAAFLVLGTAIGASVTRSTVFGLRDALVPAVVSAVLLIAAGVAIAYLLRLAGVTLPGDVLATSPGALSAVIAAATERGTGAAEVALFHTVRVVLVLLSLPALIALLPQR